MRRFIVVAPGMTSEQEGDFVTRLGEVGWWHHLPGSWIVQDPRDHLTAQTIVEILADLAPLLECAAFGVQPDGDWTTRLHEPALSRSAEWIKVHWTGP